MRVVVGVDAKPAATAALRWAAAEAVRLHADLDVVQEVTSVLRLEGTSE